MEMKCSLKLPPDLAVSQCCLWQIQHPFQDKILKHSWSFVPTYQCFHPPLRHHNSVTRHVQAYVLDIYTHTLWHKYNSCLETPETWFWQNWLYKYLRY